MIPFDFKYILPDTIEEALNAWNDADGRDENPIYYSGGTEIITLCREQKIKPGVLIDIKNIPECNILLEKKTGSYGSALTLNKIIDNTKFSYLKDALKPIADHTMRNKITLGGNIMGRLPYREAMLPFLTLNGSVEIATQTGIEKKSLDEVFNKRIILGKGEFLVSVTLDPIKPGEKYFIRRKEKNGRIDYPIMAAFFSGKRGDIRMAITGVTSYPLRDRNSEILLSNSSTQVGERADTITKNLESLFRTDFRASGEYRKHLLKLAIIDALEYMEYESESF